MFGLEEWVRLEWVVVTPQLPSQFGSHSLLIWFRIWVRIFFMISGEKFDRRKERAGMEVLFVSLHFFWCVPTRSDYEFT